MHLRASNGGNQRWGSMGKQATMDVDLSDGITTGAAPRDDEGNLSRGGPRVFPTPIGS
jgi:hypothetical protein